MKLQLALISSLFVSSYAGKHWNDWDVSGQADRDLADRCLFFIKYETGTSAFETSPGTGNTNGNCNTAYTGTSLDGDDVATVAIPSGSSNTEEFTVTLNKFGCEFTGEVRHKAANTCFDYSSAAGATSVTIFGQPNNRGKVQGISNAQMQIECNCNSAGGLGDPHIKTWSDDEETGRHFFMGECDSVLYTSQDFDNGMGLDVHIRTTVRDFYSFIEAAAVLVGNTVIEMSIGNTGTFYVDGIPMTDADLPMKIEDSYVLDKVATFGKRGSSYMLYMGDVVLELRVMKLIMAVNIMGAGPGMGDSAGQMGSFPNGITYGRDGTTIFEADGELETIAGEMNPVKNTFGLEWQVRPGQDPELFREHREPIWPNKCTFPSEEAKSAATERRKLLATIDMESATAACAEHTENTVDFDLCVMDVLAFDDLDAAVAW